MHGNHPAREGQSGRLGPRAPRPQVRAPGPGEPRGEAAALPSRPSQRSRAAPRTCVGPGPPPRAPPGVARARPRPRPRRRQDLEEGGRKEGPYPAGSGTGARRASPQAGGVGSRRPLPGSRAAAAAASPAQRDPEGRPRPRDGAEPSLAEGRGLVKGGAFC